MSDDKKNPPADRDDSEAEGAVDPEVEREASWKAEEEAREEAAKKRDALERAKAEGREAGVKVREREREHDHQEVESQRERAWAKDAPGPIPSGDEVADEAESQGDDHEPDDHDGDDQEVASGRGASVEAAADDMEAAVSDEPTPEETAEATESDDPDVRAAAKDVSRKRKKKKARAVAALSDDASAVAKYAAAAYAGSTEYEGEELPCERDTPRMTIITAAFVAISFAVVATVIFASEFFTSMMDAEVYNKVLGLESEQLKTLRAEEDKKLHQYQWVDQQKGIVRIPVDRAAELVLADYQKARPEGLPEDGAVPEEAPPAPQPDSPELPEDEGEQEGQKEGGEVEAPAPPPAAPKAPAPPPAAPPKAPAPPASPAPPPSGDLYE